jgi:hypothetical protein
MDDPTLLHTYVRERSEPAFAELVARYLPLVHAAARGSTPEAESREGIHGIARLGCRPSLLRVNEPA